MTINSDFKKMINIILGKESKPAEKVIIPWEEILINSATPWIKAKKSANKGPNILIATSFGGQETNTYIEGLLAIALTLRGANIHFLLCDKFLPACQLATTTHFGATAEFAKHGPQKSLCDSCFNKGIQSYKVLGLPVHLYSKLINVREQKLSYEKAEKIDLKGLKNYKFQGLSLGEHALAGALRFFAKASIEDEPFVDKIKKRYLYASFLTVNCIKKLLDQYKFETIVFNHGIYVPQGLIGEIARREKVRVVNWNPAYRKKCFIFSHNDTYHHTLLSEPTKSWEKMPWNQKMAKKLEKYLNSRITHKNDWIWFHENPQLKIDQIAEKLGIDFTKPTIGLLTNVLWDAQLHYRENAFPDMLSWLIKTIKYFAGRKDLQLIIRIHPAEIRGTLPSRQKVFDEINKNFPILPKNIFVIPPENNISTYSIMYKCNAVIIFGTKTGVELTSVGIPVIVAGEAWIRNKGITTDVTSAKDYFRILNTLPFKNRLGKKEVLRAQKYAFHFFFRRMIPLACVNPAQGWPPFKVNIEKLSDLLPGKDKGLDVICDGILNGTEFIYKAEDNL